jgi:hypothetical protein
MGITGLGMVLCLVVIVVLFAGRTRCRKRVAGLRSQWKAELAKLVRSTSLEDLDRSFTEIDVLDEAIRASSLVEGLLAGMGLVSTLFLIVLLAVAAVGG